MMDYRGIEALYTVQKLQSFEAAAQELHITQSAISQRIKSLENFYGKPVVTRALPYQPTELGKRLIGLFKKISLLEEDFAKQTLQSEFKPRISIALNRDSLETWFLQLVEETSLFRNISLEIIADDQEFTLDYLKNGLVSACISPSKKEIQGGSAHFIGNMEYVLVASPSFAKQFFSRSDFKECLHTAPAIKFDKNDMLHERYLEKFFDFDGRELNYHIIPSVSGFKKFTLKGYGYALIPKIDIIHELKNKQLVQLAKGKTWKIPLYWHYWSIQSHFYQQFNTHMIEYAMKKLTPQF